MRAATWMASGYAAGSLLRLTSNIVMSRLLFPEAFGLMSLVQAFVRGLAMFSDVGIQPNIVQNPNGDDADLLNTAWTIQILRGGILFAVSVAGAYPFALFYGEPVLQMLITVSALNALLSGLQSTKLATASRKMDQKSLMLTDLISQLIGAVTMVSAAAMMRSVWALVIGLLVTNSVRLVLSHAWFGAFRNRIAWDVASVRSLLRFGRWVFISTVLTFLVQQADRLVFAKMIPLALLGVYSIALGFAVIPQQLISMFGRSIAFPIYSRAYRERGEFRSEFIKMRGITVVGGGIINCAMVVSAQPLTDMLYDVRYAQAGWMLQVLSVGIWFQVLECHTGNAMLAMGQARVLALGGLVKLIAMLILIPIGYATYGFPGALMGYSAADAFRYVLSNGMATRRGLAFWTSDLIMTMTAVASICLALGAQAVALPMLPSPPVQILIGTIVVFAIWAIPNFRTIKSIAALKAPAP